MISVEVLDHGSFHLRYSDRFLRLPHIETKIVTSKYPRASELKYWKATILVFFVPMRLLTKIVVNSNLRQQLIALNIVPKRLKFCKM